MTPQQLLNHQVLVLCKCCHHRIKVVQPTNEEWVRLNCHYIPILNEYAPFVASEAVCGKCRQLILC
jgi:hypothetical protein